MRIRITWKPASNYGKEYEVEALKRYEHEGYYDEGWVVKFENGYQTFIESHRMEILEMSEDEANMPITHREFRFQKWLDGERRR